MPSIVLVSGIQQSRRSLYPCQLRQTRAYRHIACSLRKCRNSAQVLQRSLPGWSPTRIAPCVVAYRSWIEASSDTPRALCPHGGAMNHPRISRLNRSEVDPSITGVFDDSLRERGNVPYFFGR